MKKRSTKIVGAVLSVALVASACASNVEAGPAGDPSTAHQQLDPQLAAQRFTETGRYIAHLAACIASNPRSTMVNLDSNQLDNSKQSAEPKSEGNDQPIHVNVRRDGAPSNGTGTWFAHYNAPPADNQDNVAVVKVTGGVPQKNLFWENFYLTNGRTAWTLYRFGPALQTLRQARSA